MTKDSNGMEIFHKAPVPKAVLTNALPAMAAMLMVLIYNLADTFFIGQTHDALQVAAVSLATPVFLIFMALGTIFGIGGTSVISRAMGEGKEEYAKKVCSFCMWGCVGTGIVISGLFLIFMDQILIWIGASADTWEPTKTYLTIVAFCGPFVLISNCYSNVIRAEGQSGRAMMGQLIGNLLNVILDPIMILGLGWNIAGAAIATVIGNIVGAGYYILYFLRGKSTLSIHIKDFTVRNKVCSSVLAIGIPASLGSLLMSISQIVVNSRMAAYGDMAVAGIGVAMKVTMMTGMVCIGFGQGVQPLLGYCEGAKLWERLKKVMKFSLIFSFALSSVMTILCYLFTNQIVRVFLTDPEAFQYGVRFSRVLLTTSFLFGIFYVLSNALQAMGAATEALIINLSRQGLIYIPALFILEAMLGVTGLVWAQPVADLLSTALVAILYIRTMRRKDGE
ncbi:MAG: MATE family efflux transporter [Dorea sp.]